MYAFVLNISKFKDKTSILNTILTYLIQQVLCVSLEVENVTNTGTLCMHLDLAWLCCLHCGLGDNTWIYFSAV